MLPRSSPCAVAGDPIARDALNRYTHASRAASRPSSTCSTRTPSSLAAACRTLSSSTTPSRRLLSAFVFSDRVDTVIVPPKHGDSSGVRGRRLALVARRSRSGLPPARRPRRVDLDGRDCQARPDSAKLTGAMRLLRLRLRHWAALWLLVQATSLAAFVPRECCKAHRPSRQEAPALPQEGGAPRTRTRARPATCAHGAKVRWECWLRSCRRTASFPLRLRFSRSCRRALSRSRMASA